MSEYTVEQILWMAVKDIENGNALTIKEDPIDGLLPLNKKLTKRNISAQSAKYNNGQPISRPTIDTYDSICEYLDSLEKDFDYKKKIKELENKNRELILQVKASEEFSSKTLNENYRLNEVLKNQTSKK